MPTDRASHAEADPRHDPLEGMRADGTIVTGARRGNFATALMPVIDRAVACVTAIEGKHSTYVYGSVATGTARVGRSDVDLVTIGLDPGVAEGIAAALTAGFAALCRGVEIGAAQRSDHEGEGDEAHGNRVFLRHYCVHLAGPDLARDLPDFQADAAAARGFNGDIGWCARRWQQELLRTHDAKPLARRVARKTLLAVTGLVSLHDATWTTDRFAAARRWAVLRPSLAPSLDTLTAWACNASPGASPAEVQRALDGVVADVVEAFDQRIGLWAPR